MSEIDNTHVRTILTNILKTPTPLHALLFIGEKGTGKTSVARIFSKAVNCQNNAFAKKGSSAEPCNTCKNCRSIDSSTSGDVIELDAASNRGIDEIRTLIREVSYLPMHCRYRVFIIDEAHMITTDAFNALLKTLEEPPDSAIFILATTNAEKVPKTIASRCFVVRFGKGKKPDIIAMLKRISLKEKIEVDSKTLELIAGHSDSSFRDGAKLLEELVIQNKLTLGSAREFLGIVGTENLLSILEKKSMKDALRWLEDFESAGGSVKHLIEQTLEDARLQLLVKSGAIADSESSTTLTVPQVSHLMKLLLEAYQLLKIAPTETIPLEIAVVDFYNKVKGGK